MGRSQRGQGGRGCTVGAVGLPRAAAHLETSRQLGTEEEGVASSGGGGAAVQVRVRTALRGAEQDAEAAAVG